MRYLQRTKDYTLTYRKLDHLKIVGYFDSDFSGCLNNKKSRSGYVFMLAMKKLFFSKKKWNKH